MSVRGILSFSPAMLLLEVGALVVATLSLGCDRNPVAVELATLRMNGSPGGSIDIFRSLADGTGVPSVDELIPLGAVIAGRTYSFPSGSYYAVNGCSAVFFELQADQNAELNLYRAVLRREEAFSFHLIDQFGQVAHSPSGGAAQQSVALSETLWDSLLPPLSSSRQKKPWKEGHDFVQRSLSQAPRGGDAVITDDAFREGLTRRVLAAPAVIPTECVHPLTGRREVWQNRTHFDLLPGQVTLMVGGRRVLTDFAGNKKAAQFFNLVPVLVSALGELKSTRYFSLPLEPGSALPLPTVSAPVGDVMWLLPGNYRLEVNGTSRVVELVEQKGVGLSLGSMTVRSPSGFPMQERIRLGGQPIFAFINDGVLFNLDQPYLVFPGTYDVSLEGGDVRDDFKVHSGESQTVRTHGVIVRTPPCPEAQTCKPPPRITIHSERRPFVLMHVDTDVPFLLLDQPYEYGVEGIRGVLKALKGRGDELEIEVLARARFSWRLMKGPPRVRTDLVRLESLGSGLFGKSLDLLFSRPTEIYVPSGLYELSYFVGEPSQERKKTKQQVRLSSGQTVTLDVPLFSDKVTSGPLSRSGAARGAEPGSQVERSEKPARLPSRLQPLN